MQFLNGVYLEDAKKGDVIYIDLATGNAAKNPKLFRRKKSMFRLRNGFSIFDPIYLVYVWLPSIIVLALCFVIYFRVTGNIQVCKTYFPEMGLGQCYFSNKTALPPQSGKK